MATLEKLHCRVQQLSYHGDHVYTVDPAPERPVPCFKPGQFLRLTLDDFGTSGFWSETVSSPTPVSLPIGRRS